MWAVYADETGPKHGEANFLGDQGAKNLPDDLVQGHTLDERVDDFIP